MSQIRTLPDALLDAARSGEGYVFVGRGAETRRSFAHIHHASRRAACALRALGLGRGDVVALVIDDSEQFLTTLFGASIAGMTPASLYPPSLVSDLPPYLAATAAALESARARAVVTSARLVPAFQALRSRSNLRVVSALDLDEADQPDRSDLGPVSIDDIAFVQFTSGSTSAPKGVVVTHRALWANIDAINGPAGLAVTSSDLGVSWLPLYHDMGLVGMALGAMYEGRSMVLMTPEAFVKKPAAWLRAISHYRASVSFAPNFAYDLCVRRVKDRDLEGVDLSCWRVAGCGGEPIHAATLAAFADKFRAVGFRETSFVPSYGLAEHVLAATLSPLGRPVRVDHLSVEDVAARGVATVAASATGGNATVVSCGTALPGHQIRIIDERGGDLPERAIGEIVLAGPSVMRGYFADEQLTAETIRDGWLRTGDLGYVSQGELFVCGRLKDVVVINGRKYHPQDLEWAIDDLPGVRRGRVVAFGTARPGSADQVVLIAEPSGTSSPEQLRDAIRRRVVEVCGLRVDEVLLVASGTIGRTTSGKVQRAATRARYERGDLDSSSTTSSSSS